MGADERRKQARKRKFVANHGIPGTKDEKIFLVADDLDDYKTKRARQTKDSDVALSPPVLSVGTEQTRASADSDADIKGLNLKSEAKQPRFICFVGNLPFTATQEAIAQHFAKVQPRAIRHRTSKETGKSKGTAFLEFDGYDRLKTCLQTFHHSSFDDGISPARQINVELTAGGGGAKSKDRKSKLQAKNARLNEQRQRKVLEGPKKGEVHKKTVSSTPDDQSTIHPSRRSRVSNRRSNIKCFEPTLSMGLPPSSSHK